MGRKAQAKSGEREKELLKWGWEEKSPGKEE